MTIRRYSLSAITLLAGLSQIGCNTDGKRLSGLPHLFSSKASISEPSTDSAGNADEVQLANHTEKSSIQVLQADESLSDLVAIAPGVVLVDFYADWCGPCKKQATVLHEIDEYASSVNAQIIKVNVDQHRKLASEYRVASLPTLMVLQDGQVKETKTGFTASGQIQKMLR